MRRVLRIQRRSLSAVAVTEDLFTAADGLGRPHGLALDPTSGTIYWTDTQTHAIHRGRMDGSGPAETLSQWSRSHRNKSSSNPASDVYPGACG